MTAAPAKRRAAAVPRPAPLIGRPLPRIAPPVPARSDVPGLVALAETVGIRLMPWQETAGRYLTATAPDGRLLYREVAIVVARQNGKTALMQPYIVGALRAGLRVLHVAQTRELPREMFGLIGDALSAEPDLFPTRRGKVIWPRYGSGQEEILLRNGGCYRIAASNRGGARGRSRIDRLIVDETREMVDWDVVSAAEPTMTMSEDPQTVYLSNMGTEESVVLNALRQRGLDGGDPSLAYLEWSAAPERAADDREGWAEANPALGHFPQVLRELERSYTARRADGQMAIFEIERLCRAQPSVREALVDGRVWASRAATSLGHPARPFMAVSMDPDGRRASAALAWRQKDGGVALRMLFDVTGDPIDTDRLGPDLKAAFTRHRAAALGFDPMTDGALAAFFARRAQPVTGMQYANATSRFVSAVEGDRLRWADCSAVSSDLAWTTRKANAERGSFEAVRADESRPITAVLAAIRAVWLASAARRPSTLGGM